ncbi:MAG: alpha/beta fold hydrolase [Gemmatimonadaceae bacterium]
MRRHQPVSALLLTAFLFTSSGRLGGQGVQGDFTARSVTFASGETMPEVRLHYTTLGRQRKDANGVVRNAVLILHGTGGTGRGFLSPGFGGELFGPGKLLDTARFYVILPDNVGHGGSSKPSDGLRMKFPHYTYDDMVQLQHTLLVDGLGVNHLRLVMGTSMGCMHAWVWVEQFPTFVDGAVPLACAPTAIAGRNRMMRRMIMDFIRDDPDWKQGDYTSQPRGLRAAQGMLFMMTSAPLVQQRQAPTRDAADSLIRKYIESRAAATDANDMLYYFDASRDYDPSSRLAQITTPVLAINSADDAVNPPELGLMEKLIPQVRGAKYILIPTSEQTRGHGTHSMPTIWGKYLQDFLAALPER